MFPLIRYLLRLLVKSSIYSPSLRDLMLVPKLQQLPSRSPVPVTSLKGLSICETQMGLPNRNRVSVFPGLLQYYGP